MLLTLDSNCLERMKVSVRDIESGQELIARNNVILVNQNREDGKKRLRGPKEEKQVCRTLCRRRL